MRIRKFRAIEEDKKVGKGLEKLGRETAAKFIYISNVKTGIEADTKNEESVIKPKKAKEQ